MAPMQKLHSDIKKTLSYFNGLFATVSRVVFGLLRSFATPAVSQFNANRMFIFFVPLAQCSCFVLVETKLQ